MPPIFTDTSPDTAKAGDTGAASPASSCAVGSPPGTLTASTAPNPVQKIVTDSPAPAGADEPTVSPLVLLNASAMPRPLPSTVNTPGPTSSTSTGSGMETIP